MHIQSAVDRLNRQLPLKARQDQLSPVLKTLHQMILHSLAMRGTVPVFDEMAELLGESQRASAIQTLANRDLIVLDASNTEVVGAYPLTTEVTPHRLRIGSHSLCAMCALDAVSVAPMFATEVKIDSHCHVTGGAVHIHMHGSEVIASAPAEVLVGIRWQRPCGVAAHSMCTEMVFLNDRPSAQQWQGDKVDTISLFSLNEAIAFGRAFFMPLLDDSSR